jgi:hypothetical protein
MFPYERFYGFLKSLVHNRLFPEAAIVRGYETIEAVKWAMGYMDPQNPIGVPHSQHEGNLSGVGTMGRRPVTPDSDAFQNTHFTMIQQLHPITPFANEPKRQLPEDVDGRLSYQISYGFASGQIPRHSQGTLLPSSGEPKVSNPWNNVQRKDSI